MALTAATQVLTLDPLDFLARATSHIPQPRQHRLRYYGGYPHRANVYLTGAQELRHGVQHLDLMAAAGDIIKNIPLDMSFSAMATRLDGPKADGFTPATR